MIIKFIIGFIVVVYLANVGYQQYRRFKNNSFRNDLKIGDHCLVYVKVENKEYRLKGRVKQINWDDHRAFIESGFRKARGWYSIDDLYIV